MVITASKLKESEIDGLVFWREEKNKYMKYDILSTKISYSVNSDYVNKINDLFECGELANLDKSGETVLPDHFIYQLVNIPTTKPTIRKIIQLALNIGQWKAATKDTEALIKADAIFEEYNLDNIESYLRKDDIEILSKLLHYFFCIYDNYIF
jgi:DNA polymerase/3'-5' exonuclease PolX